MEFRERKRWVFFGLPFTFTVYTVKEDTLTVNTGFLNKEENDCYMYKVQDVTLKTSLFERIFGLGTIVCYTGDVTNPQLLLQHIKNAKPIKEFILEQSEIARRKRRTMNVQDISAEGIDDLDDM
ncbi:MAG: PH domain-containing protein [Lachnospiraceae bacterium]|nr:PH domain-containing protein [Lachnospiraceae bacterium]